MVDHVNLEAVVLEGILLQQGPRLGVNLRTVDGQPGEIGGGHGRPELLQGLPSVGPLPGHEVIPSAYGFVAPNTVTPAFDAGRSSH